MTTYWRRLQGLMVERGPLCVAVDPHPSILQAWELPVSAAGAERCARHLVDVLGQNVAAFKPQSAFFERYGSAGIAALERVVADIRASGAICILDVKRSDIGSTMEAYADAYLADGAPLAADAITVSPFLGFGSLQPVFERAHRFERGVYVLTRTSNPEGAQVQLAFRDESSVAQHIIDEAARVNRESRQRAIGLVVGGTHKTLGCDLDGFTGSILVPGIGAQGGRMEDLSALFGTAVDQVLVAVGRDILAAGPDPQALLQRTAKIVR